VEKRGVISMVISVAPAVGKDALNFQIEDYGQENYRLDFKYHKGGK